MEKDFILIVPGELSGKERRNFILEKTILHAYKKFKKDRLLMADWTGYSERTIRIKLKEMGLLREYNNIYQDCKRKLKKMEKNKVNVFETKYYRLGDERKRAIIRELMRG